MLQWTSILLLIAPVLLLVYAFRIRHSAQQRASLRVLVLTYFIAGSAPLLFTIFYRLDATRIVIELHAIAFRSEAGSAVRKEVRERRPGSGRIVIGDVVRRTSTQRFGTLVYRQQALDVELPPPSQRAGLIASGANGILGAAPLQDGDRLCIAGTCWTYDDRAFKSGNHIAELPRRQAEIPGLGWTFTLPFAKPMTAGVRTWSVDWLAHEAGAVAADRRLRSFIAYSNPGPDLRLLVLDRDVSLVRGGRAVATPARFRIEDGERIAFYSLPVESSTFAVPGIAERRSAVVRVHARSFELDLDTPEVHSLSAKELHALETEVAKKQRVALSMGDAQLVDRSLYFAGLSESVAVQANALLELSRFLPRDFISSFRIITPRGPVESALGRTTWVGTTDLAAIRIDVLRPPLLLLIIGLALLLTKAISAWSADFNETQMLMAGAVEILVGVRLLLGYHIWTMPPHRLEAAELALVAWMALPWMLLAASLPKLRARVSAPALAGLALSAVFCLRVVDDPTRWIWLFAHLLPLLAYVDRAQASRLLKRVRLPQATTRMFVYAAIAFTVIRLLLLLFGFKESITLGARISLSVVHIPAAVIFEGIFLFRAWKNVTRHERLTNDDLRVAMAILLFVWALPAAFTSDVGLALLNAPVFLLLLLVLARHADTKRGWVLLWALAVVIVLFVAIAPLLRVVLPLVHNDDILLAAASESNYARFFHFAAPERLQELATRRGESLAITSAILQSYISSGFFGRGYGHTEVTPQLGDTALRDFAPAVFVAAEWGLVGTVAMLLTYLLIAVSACVWLPWNDGETPAAAIAAVASMTIAIASIYMILANHELLLLTGKNAYLLGLDSAGDVMEFLVLLLVIAYGARRSRTMDLEMTYSQGTL